MLFLNVLVSAKCVILVKFGLQSVLFLRILVSKVSVIPRSFGLRSVLFLEVLVCELCYSWKFWSAKCVIPGSFGL